jgi:hypothetical protein
MKLNRSTYEVLQILSISLTDKSHLRDLFDKTNFNNIKEQFDPLIPGLFDELLPRSDFNGTLVENNNKFKSSRAKFARN